MGVPFDPQKSLLKILVLCVYDRLSFEYIFIRKSCVARKKNRTRLNNRLDINHLCSIIFYFPLVYMATKSCGGFSFWGHMSNATQ